jgi:hypothetical protein
MKYIYNININNHGRQHCPTPSLAHFSDGWGPHKLLNLVTRFDLTQFRLTAAKPPIFSLCFSSSAIRPTFKEPLPAPSISRPTIERPLSLPNFKQWSQSDHPQTHMFSIPSQIHGETAASADPSTYLMHSLIPHFQNHHRLYLGHQRLYCVMIN